MVRLKTVLIFSAVLVMFTTGSAIAGLATSHLATDAEMLLLLSNDLFVGEGRVGDGLGAATFEIDLGGDSGNPATTALYDWPNGTAVSWSLSYNSITNLITFTVDDITVQYISPLSGFTDVFLRTRAVNDGSAILVDNLVLDSEAVGDVSSATGSGLDILWISGTVLTDGFVITGQTTMSWTGAAPTQSRLAFQVKVGTLETVYVEKSTWGQMKTMFREPGTELP